MTFKIYLTLIITALLACIYAISGANEATPASACESLERPNIDCQCVAKRLSAMSEYAGSKDAAAALFESYKYALGYENADMMTLSTSDSMMVAKADIRLESFGGWPDDIDEFEESCVIADANPIEITPPKTKSVGAEHVRNCSASSSTERHCQCEAERYATRLSPEQFAAYTRGHSNFIGKPTTIPEQDNEGTLTGEAGAILEATDAADYRYCSALTYADEMPGTDSATRDQDYAPPPEVDAPPETAESLIRQNCAAGDESKSYCACYLSAYKSQIIDKAEPRAAMTVALITDSGNMDEAWVMERMSQITREDQTAMQSLMMSAMGVGNSCN